VFSRLFKTISFFGYLVKERNKAFRVQNIAAPGGILGSIQNVVYKHLREKKYSYFEVRFQKYSLYFTSTICAWP
jgi:hypothetical protein